MYLRVRVYIIIMCMHSGLGLEEEVPDYDLDSEDDEWLSAQTNERVSSLSPLSPSLPPFALTFFIPLLSLSLSILTASLSHPL